jgi:hypothetical protein
MNFILKKALIFVVFILFVDWIKAYPISSRSMSISDQNDGNSEEISEAVQNQLLESEQNKKLNAAYIQLLNLQLKKSPASITQMSGYSNDDKFLKSILETLSIFGGAKNNQQSKNNVASKDFFG